MTLYLASFDSFHCILWSVRAYLDVLLHRYEFSLTSNLMFKIVGKRCNTSVSIGTGMSEQIPGQTV